MRDDREPRAEFRALTGLRGVLAVWVVLLHTSVGMEIRGFSLDQRLGHPIANLFLAGVIAVDGFFILSGFVLSYVYAERFRWRDVSFAPRFLALRLARIYPVHLTILGIYLLLLLSGIDWPAHLCGNPVNRDPSLCERFSPHRLMESVFLINAWGVDPQIGWNLPAWSISSEWFVYLAFPVLVLIGSLFGPISAALGGILALALMIPLLEAYVPMYRGLGDDYGLLRVVPEFICGLLLYRVYRAPWFERVRWPVVAMVAIIAAVALIATGFFAIGAVFCLAALVLSLASVQEGVVSRLLSTRLAHWLGRISYSIYMVNLLALEFLSYIEKNFIRGNPLKHVWQAGATLIVAAVLCVALAALLHRFVEEPARDWVRRKMYAGRVATET